MGTSPKSVDWSKPQAVNRGRQASSTSVIGTLLPLEKDIPAPYWKKDHPMAEIVLYWGSCGLNPKIEVKPKNGIDASMAMWHLKTLLRSSEPKYSHKVAGAAFLMDQWISAITNWKNEKAIDEMRKKFTGVTIHVTTTEDPKKHGNPH